MDELADITCPRCGATASTRFYGPCDGCRAELGAQQVAAPREIEVAAYEPKANVVANHVATRES